MSYETDIAAWLQNPNREYRQGIELLRRNNRNQILANNLANRESEGNFKTLEYQLQKLAESEPVMRQLEDAGIRVPHGTTVVILHPQQNAAPAAPAAAAPEPAPEPAPELSPEARGRIDELAIEAGKLYQEQARLSNSLADLATDAERADAVTRIEELKGRRDQLAQERQALEAGGPLAPAEPQAPEQESLEVLEKRRDNLRATVSKAKKAAEKPGASAEAKSKFAQKRAELDELELAVKHVREQNRLSNA